MTTTKTTAEITDEIRSLTWKLETWLPAEMAATTHYRRLRSLRNQQAEAERALSRAVTELGSTVQADILP